jgi:hypothetical protein
MVNHYNETATNTKAVYLGCVNDATGELVWTNKFKMAQHSWHK